METFVEGTLLSGLGYGSGWALVAMVVVMIFRGTLITRREADALRDENSSLRRTLDEAMRQNTLLMQSTAPVVESTFTALRREAEK